MSAVTVIFKNNAVVCHKPQMSAGIAMKAVFRTLKTLFKKSSPKPLSKEEAAPLHTCMTEEEYQNEQNELLEASKLISY